MAPKLLRRAHRTESQLGPGVKNSIRGLEYNISSQRVFKMLNLELFPCALILRCSTEFKPQALEPDLLGKNRSSATP